MTSSDTPWRDGREGEDKVKPTSSSMKPIAAVEVLAQHVGVPAY
jgi:hypothetical protein